MEDIPFYITRSDSVQSAREGKPTLVRDTGWQCIAASILSGDVLEGQSRLSELKAVLRSGEQGRGAVSDSRALSLTSAGTTPVSSHSSWKGRILLST
jgi:hypothetical protein